MKIILADDHPLVREAMSATLASLPDVSEVVECADFGQTLAALVRVARPALCVADLVMPGMDGADGVARLVETAPEVPIVVVSGVDDPETCRAALARGARGYIPKSGSSDVFEAAIRLVMAGGTYLPPQVLDGSAQSLAVHRAATATGIESVRPPAPMQLSARQREVLQLIVKGQSNKDIARALSLSPATVKAHVATILGILGAQNRTEAVTLATLYRLL